MIKMSEEETSMWSVFDAVKSISITPEALMANINAAVTSLEHARATAFLQSPHTVSGDKNTTRKSNSQYNARIADDAYKAGLAYMAAGNLDEAALSLNVALSKCPPDKTSAVAKLRSLISLTSKKLQKSSN